MATIARLVTVMEAQMKGWEQAQSSFERTSKTMQASVGKIDSTMTTLGNTAKALASTFGIAFGAQQVIALGKEIADFSGQMLDLSAQTQISTDTLQAFNISAADVGLTIDDVVVSADQLAKRIGNGDNSAERSLNRLGITAYEFKQLNLADAMYLIDKRLVGVSNQFDRAAILADLFGRSGQRMGRMMNGSLEETIRALEKTGGIIDKELLEKADRFDEFWKHAWIKFRAYAAEGTAYVASLMAHGGLGRMISLLDRLGSGVTLPNVPNRPANLGAMSGGPAFPTPEEMKRIEEGAAKLAKRNQEAADATKRLDDAYRGMLASVMAADSEFRNARGMEQFNQDLAVMNASTSQATKNLQAMTMAAARVNATLPSSGFDTASLMGGPGAMPYGGNLFTFGSGVPLPGMGGGGGSFFGNLFGGMGDSLKSMWQGMTGGKGMSGLFSGLGSGLLTGGLSSLLGTGMSFLTKGLGKLFGGMFGGEGKKTNDMRDQAFASMGGFENVARMANEAGFSMDRLLQPKKVKDFEKAWQDLNAALGKHQEHLSNIQQLQDAQGQRQQMLQEALSRYNFSASEKGPLINMQEMAAQAEQLLTDYQLLIESGVDQAAVLREMGMSMSDFVNRALATGTEVPNAMREMIEKMIENGQLLDANGVAFESLEAAGIQFGESLTDMFKGVLQKLDELIAKLDAAVSSAGALSNISIPSGSGYVTGDQPYGSDVYGPPIPMARGGAGMVTRPTLFVAGEGGPEQFAFSGANRSFGSGGGWQQVTKAIEMMRNELRVDREVSRLMVRSEAIKALA